MFSCLWQLWDWLDPTSMENKKGLYQSAPVTPSNEIVPNESIPKHSHQHNTAPQHLRLLQYGLKIPNHQHNTQTLNQQLNSPLHLPFNQQVQYQQTSHRHLQPSPQQQLNNYNMQNTNTQYQLNQPPPLHPHNTQIQQNSPQIWVPHQPPPIHYHQQSKNESNYNKVQQQVPQQAQQQQQTNQVNKPKEVVERKKSSNTSQLRSPSAKRPLEAPVTMQGWLHKQGSEGLMLWKKRWFVLSEYCLFYYKGPEEEKLLGSILLPSYRVSICGPDDKVNKKYAFKCEHANMRTYILAADSQDLMLQWIRVLNLACLLQTNVETDQQSGSLVPSSFNQSNDNSDSGFHYQHQQAHPQHHHNHHQQQQQNVANSRTTPTPIHMHSSSNTTELSNPSQQELSQYNQPLYANAPPKPRRLNDGGYSSPSPDVLERYNNSPQIRNIAKSPVNHHYYHHLNSNAIMSIQSPNHHHPSDYSHLQQQHRPKYNHNDYNNMLLFNATPTQNIIPQNVERRTPDTYGRSNLNPIIKSRHPTDYEDVYAEQQQQTAMYKRPLSPIAYNSHVKKTTTPTPIINPAYRAYTPVNMLGPKDIDQYPSVPKKSPSQIARPHSADFLEYELNHRQSNVNNMLNRQQPRPKSSLDINRNCNDSDNYFYTEERYAEKMRKSAQYLPKMPKYLTTPNEMMQHRKIKYSENDSGSNVESTSNYHLMRSNTQPINFNNVQMNLQPVRSRSVLSEGSLSKELDIDLRTASSREALSPGYSMRQDMYNNYEDGRREYDQFSRSASARLAQNGAGSSMDEKSFGREGDRKREESMKRLLEWKQRMLQSPLNRKAQNHRIYSGRPDLYYKNQEYDYLQQNQYPLDGSGGGRRSANNLPPQYNSYSSDDEENMERSKETVQSQAGRTLDTFPNNCESLTPAHCTNSITVFDSLKKPDKPNSNLMHDNNSHNSNNNNNNNSKSDDTVKNENSNKINNNNNNNNNDEDDDSTFTKPLIQLNKELSNLAHVSSLRAEYSNKFEQSPVVTEIKSNGALVKSILAEFEKKIEDPELPTSTSATPTNECEETVPEENYMTMTPKKQILNSQNSIASATTASSTTLTASGTPTIDNAMLLNELEENPYVEMTQNIDLSLLADNLNLNEHQSYEMVCFTNQHKFEPLYMELKNSDQCKTNAMHKHLPDILNKNSQCESTTKSDSSDADDEASKDLDSIDTPTNPRFSLSDNFRPASYYLGASQIVQEFQDSSDSELVSPPPIPISPLIDEFESNDHTPNRNSDQYFNSIRQKADSDKNKNFLSLTSLKDQADISSICCTINSETERQYACNRTSSTSSRMSQNSDSDIELRNDYERMLKRRPLSEEFCDELESMDGTFNDTTIDLDKYLTELDISNVTSSNLNDSAATTSLNDQREFQFHEYENFFISSNNYAQTIEKNLTIKSTTALDDRHSLNLSADEYVTRGRPESSASTSAEICGLLQVSNRSTPSIRISSSMSVQELPTGVSSYFSDQNKSTNSTAPYYYSDLSMNTTNTDSTSTILTLNNQRGMNNGSKRDITHIINPIKCNNSLLRGNGSQDGGDGEGAEEEGQSSYRNIINSNNTFKLAAEARSASVDFLNLTDKSGHIDKKNIYESDTLKRLKESSASLSSSQQGDLQTRNLFPIRKTDKFNGIEVTNESNINNNNVRRSHSLEGLLENVLSETVSAEDAENYLEQAQNDNNNQIAEGSYLWEEDSIWRERLRSASQRHTKSMDDLDCIGGDNNNNSKIAKKSLRGITRGVTYVNDNIYNMPVLNMRKDQEIDDEEDDDGNIDDADDGVGNINENSGRINANNNSSIKKPIKKEGSFIIDREKLRQWDLLSSAPSDDQLSTVTASQVTLRVNNNTVIEIGDGSTCEPSDSTNTQQAASGSISINTRDTFPKAISSKRIWTPNVQTLQSRSVSNVLRAVENDYMPSQQGYYMSPSMSQHDFYDSNSATNIPKARKEHVHVSAGELLGRTHEELVLLLIQLRRQSANTLQAIENSYNEVDTIQAQLHGNLMNQAKRLENLQKLEQIKQHLIELEKQYEKRKPLVNLVDNMVKLGSLYRSPNEHYNSTPHLRDRLEFNQQIQERRLLAEEKRDWNRLNPNHLQLQEKVQQLYQLDRLIQEESGTLQNLQQDKEDIERALGGLRHRLNKGFNNPAEIEQARKQQANLENELSRVHLMLAQNSKKLEETVAGNARLEQELLILKQKLQVSRQQRSSPQFSNAGDSLPCAMGTSAMLESDLQRVQQKVGDLQKQRQELSMQVRQLTDRSNNLQQQIKHSPSQSSIANQNLGNRKKVNSLWRETDLDTMHTVDHGDSWDNFTNSDNSITPLYINTDINKQSDDYYGRGLKSIPTNESTMTNTSEDSNQTSNCHEKQEIKTVRIVKRESERRQRDREKTSTTGGKWDALFEEDTSSQNSSVLFRPTPVQKTQSITNVTSPTTDTSGIMSRQSSLSSPSLPQNLNEEKSPNELSPIFKSEAARQIITEMSSIQESPRQTNRRAIPKEKRRHYTAPHNNLIMKSLNQLPTNDEDDFDKMLVNNDRRARDDLDMERALRQRIDAPDVVRSTLSTKEFKYNESTIDNILGTPNKINIPERYIPEQLPQLSAEEQEHRLKKVESIKKMLSDSAIISASSSNLPSSDEKQKSPTSSVTNKVTTKMIEEKKQREHLLQLNQILAKQVMEMSKIVAVKALSTLPLEPQQINTDEDEDSSSPVTPLPLYQQRDNFYS